MRVSGRNIQDFKERYTFIAALSHTLSDPITEETTETQNTQEHTARGLKHTRGDEAEWTPRGTQLDRVTVRDCQNKTGNVTLTQTQRRTNHGQKGKDTWRHVEETNKPEAKLETNLRSMRKEH